MESDAGIFVHNQAVIDLAYTLVREYEEHERSLNRSVTHRNLWHKMRSKCTNKDGWYYARYGGCGIRVCARWDRSLADFANDMGSIPDEAIGVQRIQKDKHFTPENTVWKY